MTFVIHDGSDREAWKIARRYGVGASEVPILFGCGYGDSSELRLFAEKTGLDVSPFEETEGMRMGRRLEGPIVEEVCDRAVVVTWERNAKLYGSDELPFACCTPDGLIESLEPIEVKNICHHLEEGEWEGSIPLRYMLQIQTQIAIMGAKRGLFGALIFGGRIVWDWIDRDEAMINDIRSRVARFWRRVQENDPPSSNGTRDARDAAFKLAEKAQPKEVFDGEIKPYLLDWESIKQAEKVAKAQAKQCEEKRRSIEDTLAQMMGANDAVFTSSGVEIRKTRQERKGGYTKPSVVLGLKITTKGNKVA
jgi:predicted phage-related endonuclease